MSVRAALTAVGLAVAGLVLVGGTAMAATPTVGHGQLASPGDVCQDSGSNCGDPNDFSGGHPSCPPGASCNKPREPQLPQD